MKFYLVRTAALIAPMFLGVAFHAYGQSPLATFSVLGQSCKPPGLGGPSEGSLTCECGIIPFGQTVPSVWPERYCVPNERRCTAGSGGTRVCRLSETEVARCSPEPCSNEPQYEVGGACEAWDGDRSRFFVGAVHSSGDLYLGTLHDPRTPNQLDACVEFDADAIVVRTFCSSVLHTEELNADPDSFERRRRPCRMTTGDSLWSCNYFLDGDLSGGRPCEGFCPRAVPSAKVLNWRDVTHKDSNSERFKRRICVYPVHQNTNNPMWFRLDVVTREPTITERIGAAP